MTDKPLDLEKLKQKRITLPLIMLLGFVLLGYKADGITVDYLGEFFIEKAEAEETTKIFQPNLLLTSCAQRITPLDCRLTETQRTGLPRSRRAPRTSSGSPRAPTRPA